MTPRSATRSLLPALLVLALFAGLLAACGGEEEHSSVVEGEPVEVGELRYNVIFSRNLNRNDTEDRAYLVGQPPAPAGGSYFGAFLQVKNEDDENSHRLPTRFTITDIEGREYRSIPNRSLYRLKSGGIVPPGGDIPELDSTAQQGPIEGALVLFRIPDEAAQNRPLILHIPGADGHGAEVQLDL